MCVPDTPQSEKDASETVVTRLEQHLWAVYEEHCLEEAQIKNLLKSVRLDVQERADDKPLARASCAGASEHARTAALGA